MNHKIRLMASVTALGLASSAAAAPTRAAVTITISAAQSDRGTIKCTLYRTEDGYPTEPDKAFRRTSSKLKGKRAKCVFKDLRPGRYAVAGFHDEDNDGEMAANFLGIPQEGTLASNDAEGFFGPPSFEDAAFVLTPRGFNQTVQLSY